MVNSSSQNKLSVDWCSRYRFFHDKNQKHHVFDRNRSRYAWKLSQLVTDYPKPEHDYGFQVLRLWGDEKLEKDEKVVFSSTFFWTALPKRSLSRPLERISLKRENLKTQRVVEKNQRYKMVHKRFQLPNRHDHMNRSNQVGTAAFSPFSGHRFFGHNSW